jgi:flavin reductase
MINGSEFKKGMRRLAAGVSIITSTERGQPCGFAATSVSSVTAEPRPSLLVCVNQKATSHDIIHRSGVFCVNLLGEGDAELAQRFSAPGSWEARFEGCDWVPLVTGSPALLGALASFDCEVASAVVVHSHTIFIGEVRDLKLWQEAVAPLLYVDGRFGSLAQARL